MSVHFLDGDQVRHRREHAADLGAVLLDDHVTDPLEAERAQRLALVLVTSDTGPDLLDLEAPHHSPTSERARSSAAGATCSTVRPRRTATVSGSTSILSAVTVA